MTKQELRILNEKAQCFDIWQDKTKWVQEEFNKGILGIEYGGEHRADIMSKEIMRLRSEVENLTKHLSTSQTTMAGPDDEELIQDMLKVCPFYGPSTARDAFIMGWERAVLALSSKIQPITYKEIHAAVDKLFKPTQPVIPAGWVPIPAVKCPVCSGSGEDWNEGDPCHACGGTGKLGDDE